MAGNALLAKRIPRRERARRRMSARVAASHPLGQQPFAAPSVFNARRQPQVGAPCGSLEGWALRAGT